MAVPDELAMRLTCPNCGADYDIPEGMVPAAGRHVQCSACHTRWFVRGSTEAPTSEDQILSRLENWRPRPVTLGSGTPPLDAGRLRVVEPLRIVPAAEPPSEAVPPAEAAEVATAAEPSPRVVAPEPAWPKREFPTKPADRPTVARPAAVADAPARQALRLDLKAPRAEPAPVRASRSRFLHGFVLVLALALVAFGLYRFAGEIAGAVPATGPALDAYARTIEGWRADFEEVVAPYRSG
jgi:predicted Zn finger-like uncharacterized protein